MSAPVSANPRAAPAPEQGPGQSQQPARSSRSQLGGALVLFAAVALEAFPVAAWLSLLAASAGASAQAAALPLWWLYGVILVGAMVTAAFDALVGSSPATELRSARRVVAALVVVGWAGSVLLSLVISPDAYPGQGLPQAIVSLATDLGSGGGRLGTDFGLAVIVAYLWWRGLTLTRDAISRDRVYIRFMAGLAAIVLAITGAAATTGAPRSTLISVLLLLLVADVFAGLVGLALAHIADTARERNARRPLADSEEEAAPVINSAWIITALGISALIVLLALALGLVFSYDTLRTLIDLLRPVGAALGQLLEWIVEGIAFVLILILNPLITWLKSLATRHHATSVPTQPTSKPPIQQPPPTNLPPEWLLAGRLVLAGLLVLIVAFVLVRLLRRMAVPREEQGFEEERETLDASALLGQQLRDLFARRGAAPAGPVEEALAPGSVRYLYRELLRTAARIGHPRRASETPDEYARRLRDVLPTPPATPDTTPGQPATDDSLAELTSAYDAVRYGDAPAGTPAQPPIAGAWQAIQRRLADDNTAGGRRRGLFRRRT